MLKPNQVIQYKGLQIAIFATKSMKYVATVGQYDHYMTNDVAALGLENAETATKSAKAYIDDLKKTA
jgi:hypothetical protein